MVFQLLIPFAAAAIGKALFDSFHEEGIGTPAFPSADISGRYIDDGDGLRLTLTGWKQSSGTLAIHGRSPNGQYLKAAHDAFADRDGDFVLVREIAGGSSDFYLPHGAVLGYERPKLRISVRVIELDSNGKPKLLSEDFLGLDAEDREFSLLSWLRPLVALVKLVAESDGELTSEEVRFVRDHFKAMFTLGSGDLDQLRMMLKTPVQQSLEEACNCLRYRAPEFDRGSIASLLCQLASADRAASHVEAETIHKVMTHLGMAGHEIEQYIGSLGIPDRQKVEACLAVLGLSGRPSKDELQKAWRRRIKDFHPDRYQGTDLPESVKEMIARESTEINTAYDTLRGIYGY